MCGGRWLAISLGDLMTREPGPWPSYSRPAWPGYTSDPVWALSSSREAAMGSPRWMCQATAPVSQRTFNLLPPDVRGYYLKPTIFI